MASACVAPLLRMTCSDDRDLLVHRTAPVDNNNIVNLGPSSNSLPDQMGPKTSPSPCISTRDLLLAAGPAERSNSLLLKRRLVGHDGYT